jgi:hypothetical protein
MISNLCRIIFSFKALKVPRTILMLLNPFSGEKKTRYYLNKDVAPMLIHAQVNYVCFGK